MPIPFRVGLSADFKIQVPGILEPLVEETFSPFPLIHYEFFEFNSEAVDPAEIAGFDVLITMHPRFIASSFNLDSSVTAVCRWGAGYDWIDVPACTQADVLLAITPDSVRKPVAEANVTFILALAKKIQAKDRLVRSGRWDLKAGLGAVGLSGKTVGSVGLGNIASETFRLLQPFDLGRKLAYDPYISKVRAEQVGVELASLEAVFQKSDFVMVNCLLNEETRDIIGRRLLELMKPSAYLINAARGPIVNQADLTQILKEKRIAGAALDVFEEEPISSSDPLVQLDNVLLSPHGIAWTDDLYRGNTIGACENALTILRGEIPKNTVNREVTGRSGFQSKLNLLGERWRAFTK